MLLSDIRPGKICISVSMGSSLRDSVVIEHALCQRFGSTSESHCAAKQPVDASHLQKSAEGPGVIAAIIIIQRALVRIEPPSDAWCLLGMEVPDHPVRAAFPEPANLMMVDEPAQQATNDARGLLIAVVLIRGTNCC